MSTAQDRSRWKQIEFAIGREDWKQARKLIRMWLRRSPNSHWLLTRMGLTYYEQRQYRRALGYERRAMRCQLSAQSSQLTARRPGPLQVRVPVIFDRI